MRLSGRWDIRTVALVVLAATTACATLSGDAFAPPPSPFRGVRSLVLVRTVEVRGERPKDALDGLDETLRARGFTTRVVELGRKRAPELVQLERLFDRLAVRASASRSERAATPLSVELKDLGEVVAGLGVDAIATYHRLDRALPSPPPLPVMGSVLPTPAAPDLERPLGALTLVDRAGHVATFTWGDAGTLDPGAPLNAADAIELLVHAIAADAEEYAQ